MATIYIGSDHNGFEHKAFLKQSLQGAGHTVIDIGPTVLDPEDDYTDYAIPLAKEVAAGRGMGIFICGSGNGPCMTANKIHGIRAGVARTVDDARGIRSHQDANVLCLGAQTTSQEECLAAAQAFLETPFAGGRHQRRVEKMMGLEKK